MTIYCTSTFRILIGILYLVLIRDASRAWAYTITLPTFVSNGRGVLLSQSLLRGEHARRSLPRMALRDADMTPEQRNLAVEKATKAMTAFSNQYISKTKTRYCSDLSVPAVVIKGLAEHKVTLGAPLCPCRYYEDKEKEAKDGFWNCPCVPMRERHECHCMLFLTEDNDFVGDETKVSFDEVVEKSSGAVA